ncbi:MAG: ABC transporter ATP-binding protein [Coprothermobacterota bacterium]|nr:ABC transporter ATP-binding protein [Coprothermobacterota bacterium]
MPPLLMEAENLTVTYGSYAALKKVNFSVFEGEIVAIVGPNGAGKTTFLETVAGLLKPKEGSLKFRDRNITKLEPFQRRKMGLMLIPQEGNLFPSMPVKENLQLGAFFENKRSTEEILNRVYRIFPKLQDRTRQLAGTLSGGEQRMLAIGMGIAANVKALMIDELSLGLAPKVVGNLLSILRDLRDETGITLILSEQSIKALDVADRVYGLEAGEIRFTEDAQQLDRDLIKSLYLGA